MMHTCTSVMSTVRAVHLLSHLNVVFSWFNFCWTEQMPLCAAPYFFYTTANKYLSYENEWAWHVLLFCLLKNYYLPLCFCLFVFLLSLFCFSFFYFLQYIVQTSYSKRHFRGLEYSQVIQYHNLLCLQDIKIFCTLCIHKRGKGKLDQGCWDF